MGNGVGLFVGLRVGLFVGVVVGDRVVQHSPRAMESMTCKFDSFHATSH